MCGLKGPEFLKGSESTYTPRKHQTGAGYRAAHNDRARQEVLPG
jgi:hypothetical protein